MVKIESIEEINKELDNLGAPKNKSNGPPYSLTERLRTLNQQILGESYSTTIKTQKAFLEEAIRLGDIMLNLLYENPEWDYVSSEYQEKVSKIDKEWNNFLQIKNQNS